jgi:hypothetical protein
VKRFLICTTLMLLPFSVLAQDYLPRDVQSLIDLRAGCEARGSCGATGKELVLLKRKYAANSTITQILNQFEAGTDTVNIVETPEPAPGPKKSQPRKAGFSLKGGQAKIKRQYSPLAAHSTQ